MPWTSITTGLLACASAFALGCGDDFAKSADTITTSAQKRCAELEREVSAELESDGGVDQSSTFGLGECRESMESASAESMTAPSVEALIATVKSCLSDAGIDARGAAVPRSRDDEDAPDGELLAPGPTFIAFYSAVKRADELAGQLQTRATELGGTTTRHGRITVLYVKVPETGADGEPDDRIEGCVEDVERTVDTLGPADAVRGSSQVRKAIRADDPASTGRALDELGYEVSWLHVRDNPDASTEVSGEDDPPPGASDNATLVTEVESPPAGTIVLMVMNTSGGARIPPPPARLLIEVARPGTAGHG